MANGFNRFIDRLLNYFVPEGDRGDANLHRSSRIRISIFLITAVLYMVYIPDALKYNLVPLAWIHFFASLFIIIVLFLYRKNLNHTIAAHMYLAPAALGIFSGTYYLGGLSWVTGILLIPSIAMLVGNKRISFIWLVISVIFIYVIYYLTTHGYPMSVHFEAMEMADLQFSGIIGIIIALFFSLSVFDNEKKRAMGDVLKINVDLNHEKKKTDNLLLNILPVKVADELKATGETVAKDYEHVTVMFTDFVNFTGLSEHLSPAELVAELHKLFTLFDQIIDKYGMEKIKTIGDAYLAVSGLPAETENHAQVAINAAHEILQALKDNNSMFEVRIGINTGHVVAGVVGVKKYVYDIWGDAVNTASRMEENSEPGKINISASTFEYIKDTFHCEYRGKILAKNKGEIDMYFVD